MERSRLELGELRAAVREAAGRVLDPGEPRDAVEEMWLLGMRGASSSALGAALWQIWTRIRDEWTDAGGDPAQGARWARESALELLEAIGDGEAERAYADRWIYDEELGIAPE
jgi:hypothetical protein